MNSESIKQSVVDNYGKLAKYTTGGLFSKLFACCDLSTNANKVGEQIGYSKAEMESVPQHANLGVGCGNPSALAKIQAGETVVDLGSGAGFDAFLVAPIVGETGKVIGVDLSEDMLALARKNARKGNYGNTEFVNGNIEELPLPDNTADHVISNCVINLSLNKGAVFQEGYRVLKNGGRLSISDIVLKKELPAFIKNSLAGHMACVSGAEKVEEYLEYIRAAGFQDIKIESETIFPMAVMLNDPQIRKLAEELNFNIDSEEAKEIASYVRSISVTAKK